MTFSSAASTSDHALVTAGYLDNNYYTKSQVDSTLPKGEIDPVTGLASAGLVHSDYVKVNPRKIGAVDAIAYGIGDIAIGDNAIAGKLGDNYYATAIGYNAQATSVSSTAIGYKAQATGDNSTALGEEAQATGVGSTALGRAAQATGDNSTALGRAAQATGTQSTALGRAAHATGYRSTALGFNSMADQQYTISVGKGGTSRNNRIVNLADGFFDQDAVTVNQIKLTQDGNYVVKDSQTASNFYHYTGELEVTYDNSGTPATATLTVDGDFDMTDVTLSDKAAVKSKIKEIVDGGWNSGANKYSGTKNNYVTAISGGTGSQILASSSRSYGDPTAPDETHFVNIKEATSLSDNLLALDTAIGTWGSATETGHYIGKSLNFEGGQSVGAALTALDTQLNTVSGDIFAAVTTADNNTTGIFYQANPTEHPDTYDNDGKLIKSGAVRALDATLVHKTGPETITGTKTFSEQINATNGIKAGTNTTLVDGTLTVGNGSASSTLTDSALSTATVNAGANTSLAQNALTLSDGTNTTILSATTNGLNVSGGAKVNGALGVTGLTTLSATTGLRFGTDEGSQVVKGIVNSIPTKEQSESDPAYQDRLKTNLVTAKALKDVADNIKVTGANMALVSDANGKVISHGSTTADEIGYVSGVTGAIQTQLGAIEANTPIIGDSEAKAISTTNTVGANLSAIAKKIGTLTESGEYYRSGSTVEAQLDAIDTNVYNAIHGDDNAITFGNNATSTTIGDTNAKITVTESSSTVAITGNETVSGTLTATGKITGNDGLEIKDVNASETEAKTVLKADKDGVVVGTSTNQKSLTVNGTTTSKGLLTAEDGLTVQDGGATLLTVNTTGGVKVANGKALNVGDSDTGDATFSINGTGAVTSIDGTAATATGNDKILATMASVSRATSDATKYVKVNSTGDNAASATGTDAIAIGKNTQAGGVGAIALGVNSKANMIWDTTEGKYVSANTIKSIAQGAGAIAAGNNSIAMGTDAVAGTLSDNKVTGSADSAIAIGNSAQATGGASIALGVGAEANGTSSIALGSFSKTLSTDGNAVSVGYYIADDNNLFRRIINAADGTSAHDVATIGQVNTNNNTVLGAIYKVTAANQTVAYDDAALTDKLYSVKGTGTASTNLTGALNNIADNVKAITGGAISDAGDVVTNYASNNYVSDNASLLSATSAIDKAIGTWNANDREVATGVTRSSKLSLYNAETGANGVGSNLMALDTAIVKEIYDREQAIADMDEMSAEYGTGDNKYTSSVKVEAEEAKKVTLGVTKGTSSPTLQAGITIDGGDTDPNVAIKGKTSVDGTLDTTGKITGNDGLEIKDVVTEGQPAETILTVDATNGVKVANGKALNVGDNTASSANATFSINGTGGVTSIDNTASSTGDNMILATMASVKSGAGAADFTPTDENGLLESTSTMKLSEALNTINNRAGKLGYLTENAISNKSTINQAIDSLAHNVSQGMGGSFAATDGKWTSGDLAAGTVNYGTNGTLASKDSITGLITQLNSNIGAWVAAPADVTAAGVATDIAQNASINANLRALSNRLAKNDIDNSDTANNFVHKSGSENITGAKTFSQTIASGNADAGTYNMLFSGKNLTLSNAETAKITLDAKDGNATFAGTVKVGGTSGATLTGTANGLTSDKKVVSVSGFEVDASNSLTSGSFKLAGKEVTSIDTTTDTEDANNKVLATKASVEKAIADTDEISAEYVDGEDKYTSNVKVEAAEEEAKKVTLGVTKKTGTAEAETLAGVALNGGAKTVTVTADGSELKKPVTISRR